jgi:hypothetical protein
MLAILMIGGVIETVGRIESLTATTIPRVVDLSMLPERNLGLRPENSPESGQFGQLPPCERKSPPALRNESRLPQAIPISTSPVTPTNMPTACGVGISCSFGRPLGQIATASCDYPLQQYSVLAFKVDGSRYAERRMPKWGGPHSSTVSGLG